MTTPDAEPTTETRHDEGAGRYELVLDGEVVAFTDHRPGAEGVWVFPHTVTEPAHRGHGYAGQVVAAAMADVRERGLKVEPACWYVAQWFDAHPDEADLLA